MSLHLDLSFIGCEVEDSLGVGKTSIHYIYRHRTFVCVRICPEFVRRSVQVLTDHVLDICIKVTGPQHMLYVEFYLWVRYIKAGINTGVWT